MVAIDVDNFAATTTAPADMLGNASYNLSGSAKLALFNGKSELYFIKPLNLATSTSLKASEMIKNSFTQDLATPKAIENYTLLVRTILLSLQNWQYKTQKFLPSIPIRALIIAQN
ncbi:hypothetical protein FAM09_05025 [Niastella caeni]|uniref:Uncharacterized protein n=1 Tax=Niastella caeni TaxID=2569763 RepID=A0A4S8I4G0_9BACT|nr:hypothetical protein [Niastella caeni]THU41472.1 hypothetical protein FAM09_05025 [Niastella caeni]